MYTLRNTYNGMSLMKKLSLNNLIVRQIELFKIIAELIFYLFDEKNYINFIKESD